MSSPCDAVPGAGSDKRVSLLAETHARYDGDTTGGLSLDGALHVAPYEWSVENFVHPESRVLDLGCGTGFGTRILSRVAAHVTGVDIHTVTPRASDERISFLTGDITSARPGYLQGQRFGCIVSHEVIEHLEDYYGFLDNVVRWLDVDGVAVIGTPNRVLTYERYPGRSHMDASHVQEFTPVSLEATLRSFFDSVDLYAEWVPGHWSRSDAHRSGRTLASRVFPWVPPRLLPMAKRVNGWLTRQKGESGSDRYSVSDVRIEPLAEAPLNEVFRLIAVCRHPSQAPRG